MGVCCFGPNNQASVKNIINKVDGRAELCLDSSAASGYKVLVLPGVGSYDFAMNILHNNGWVDSLKKHLDNGGFVLGICLGMQLLCQGSEEGNLEGLGLIPGKFVRFNEKKSKVNLKIPHMGWNRVDYVEDIPLKFDNNLENKKYYFIHSYHYEHETEDFIYGYTNYGYKFGSAIGSKSGRIIGVQFHPEKSHLYGMQFFKNYLKFIERC